MPIFLVKEEETIGESSRQCGYSKNWIRNLLNLKRARDILKSSREFSTQ
nr:12612_t:CDS:2 [Entrophospora candida]